MTDLTNLLKIAVEQRIRLEDLSDAGVCLPCVARIFEQGKNLHADPTMRAAISEEIPILTSILGELVNKTRVCPNSSGETNSEFVQNQTCPICSIRLNEQTAGLRADITIRIEVCEPVLSPIRRRVVSIAKFLAVFSTIGAFLFTIAIHYGWLP
jgi:hypothetical protein